MTTRLRLALAIFNTIGCIFSPLFAYAYEVETHALMSQRAAEQSNLGGYLPMIGLTSLNDQLTDGFGTESIRDWIRSGAIDEDDYFSASFFRFRNHFYNPLPNAPNEGGYSYGFLTGVPSPDWGLEDTQTFSTQFYSWKEACQYFYDGLTLPDRANREQFLSRTFNTLGHVIHLIQDMAQPQHTRNDSHGGFFLGPSSFYEFYTNQIREGLPFAGYTPVYPGGDPGIFNTPRRFWTTNDGKGIADYSNRGFVSAGTNFTGTSSNIQPAPDFPSPNGTGAIVVTREITDPDLLGPNQPLIGLIDFIGTPVEDRYRPNPSDFNPRTSSYSIFDPELTTSGFELTFTLNRFNIDEAHKFLIPRAVGYSAGLINYFFRGKIDLIADPNTPGAYVIQNLGADNMDGTFTLYYDAADGTRHKISDASWPLQIAVNGQSKSLTFTAPTDPAPKLPGEYMLVFNGTMGQEQPVNGSPGAIVGKQISCTLKTDPADYPPPSFTGNRSYESLPLAWLTTAADGALTLNGYIWILKNPIPPPQLRCFPLPGPPYCYYYLYYPASPYFNYYDSLGDRYTPQPASSDEFVKAWIDLNGDKSFTDDELVFDGQFSPFLVAGSWYTNQLITIQKPLAVSPMGYCGTVMRVALRWSAPPTGPYDTWEYGDVHDFQVELR